MVVFRFLIASLNMDVVLAEATIHQRRQIFHRMTKGLGLQGAYDTTLGRIRQGGSKAGLGMKALMWISHCERRLRSLELCNALGVEIGAEDFSIQNVPSIRTVLGYTLGLATIDEEASTLRLLHFTLQEYLGQHPTLFVTAHSLMAETCLTYLNSRPVLALPLDLNKALETTPFLEYATCFWGTHAVRGLTDQVKSLALRLLNGYENHIAAAVLWRHKMYRWSEEKDVRGITGLHCIAFWGIEEIAVAVLGVEGRQVNACDSRGWTPLMWAFEYNDRGMVELFLEQEDIELETASKDGRTVFSFVAELGKEDAVKLLLERRDVDPNSTNSNGRTPLSFAAQRGREGVVKLLLEWSDVDPNFSDKNGRTPLSFAVEKIRHDASWDLSYRVPRHESVIRLLLERGDIDPNSPDGNGRTPLSLAAEKGQEGVVKLLLERRDVDPNSSDKNGRTPLSFAAEKLLGLDYFRGPFPRFTGHESVIRLLLGRGDVDPN